MTTVGSPCSAYGGIEFSPSRRVLDCDLAWFAEFENVPESQRLTTGVPTPAQPDQIDWTTVAACRRHHRKLPCQPFSHAEAAWARTMSATSGPTSLRPSPCSAPTRAPRERAWAAVDMGEPDPEWVAELARRLFAGGS